MTRYRELLVLVLFAAITCSGVLAVPALGEEPLAQWLVNGEAVTSLGFEGTVELLVEDTKTTAGKVAVTCDAIFVGTMSSGGEAEITEVLNLAKEKIGALGGLALLCKTETTCENNTDVEAWPTGLPWTMEAADISGIFWDIVSTSGVEVSCLVIGIKVEDECTASDTPFRLKNVTEGVALEAAEESGGTCTLGGSEAGSADTVISGLLAPSAGGTLSVSE